MEIKDFVFIVVKGLNRVNRKEFHFVEHRVARGRGAGLEEDFDVVGGTELEVAFGADIEFAVDGGVEVVVLATLVGPGEEDRAEGVGCSRSAGHSGVGSALNEFENCV